MVDPNGSCIGKHPFSRRDAHAALRNHHRRGRRALHAYRCQICDCFHIGAKKARAPRPKRPRGEW